MKHFSYVRSMDMWNMCSLMMKELWGITMTDVRFYRPTEIADELLKFTVIAARFEDHWIFSRHKQRSTWDIPGGRREPGEPIDETARRELWEETGAEQARIVPVCIYGVTKDGETKYGMLYAADVTVMGPLPEKFEMGETILTDKLPESLTYPDIVPHLFEKVQGWLNLQSGAGEPWDVYDEDRNLTGRIHRRGDQLGEGEYHLVVHIWMVNSRGEFLLTKRSPNKGFPNMWETTGGSALAGDDSLTAALREVKEETGLTLDAGKGVLISSTRQSDYFRDVWLFRQEFDLAEVVLQPGETTDKRYADKQTILRIHAAGELVPYSYLETLFDQAGL